MIDADSATTPPPKKIKQATGAPVADAPATSATGVNGAVETSPLKRDSTHKSGWSKGDTLASRHLLDLVAKNRSTSIPQFLAAFVDMGMQVADALHYAHEMGIVHRDIKPSNLLLDVDGEVWVADFGLAQIQSDPGMTATGAIVGTLRYMSPEQAMGKRVGVDHRTDIYSFGVTLYELLTLRPAYGGDSRETITSTAFSPDKFRILTASSPKQAADDVNGELVGRSPSLWDSVKLSKLLSFEGAFLFEAHPACFDPEGRRAVFPSLGHSATIYDCVAGHDLVQLSGHDKRVVFAAFSPRGDRVATASDDNTVRVWDANSGAQIYQFDLWKKRDPSIDQCVIDSVAFRPDGRQLVTGSRTYGIHLWDLSTGTRINDEHLKGGCH